MNDVTIIVNSCDKYEDAWYPFFKLFSIQWPQCPYEIVLNSEKKTYECEFLNVRTIVHPNGESLTWSQRLKNVLDNIETEYILYFLEDFFLKSPVSVESFNKALELIRKDKTIGYIGLKYNTTYNFKEGRSEDLSLPFLNKDDLKTVNRINSMTALWRKDWLYSLIRDHETPWDFELYGSVRSRRTDKQVLIINNFVNAPVFDYGVDVQYGLGIFGGKWLPKNKELFDKYDIEVNFERLGIYEDKTKEYTKSLESKSRIREKLYWFKWKAKRTKKWLIKQYRKYKSLR